MKTLAYGFFLILLLAASILLVRAFRPTPGRQPLPQRLVALAGKNGTTIDLAKLAKASPSELYSLGVDYMQYWRVRDATVLFEHAVAADSTLHDAWLRLVECYADPLVANEGAVRRALARAAATSPSPADTMMVSALRELYDQRNYAGAVTTLATLLHRKTAPPETRYHLALAYFLLGHLKDADKQLEVLMKTDATVGPVAELSIRRAAAARDFGRAAAEARELARQYPDEPFPDVLVAQVEMARGKKETAAEFCHTALTLDPKCAPAIMTRALLYAEANEFDAARVSYEKLMVFDEPTLQSIGHEGIGYVDFLDGRFDDGVDEMDEAIRLAMVAGSPRRGLAMAAHLVDYLCQLGQAERAESVAERWATGFGPVPVRLVRTRIQVLRGDFESAGDALDHLNSETEWVQWSHLLGVDPVELSALAEIGQQQQTHALELLSRSARSATVVAAGAAARRTFVAGYAAFENGDAESAAKSFASVRERNYGLEFPYHGDPVVYVQSLFFLAESELARGAHLAARKGYEGFLGYWGDADWNLEAVGRARKKLESLKATEVTP